MRPIHIPPRTRGTISASLEGLRRAPSTAPRISDSLEGSAPTLERANISASLEGSEPTLEQATHLRLARGHPSA